MSYAYNLRRPSLKDQRNYTYFRFCIEIGARPLSPMQGIRLVGSPLYPIFSNVRYSHIPYKTYYSVVQSQKAVTAYFLVAVTAFLLCSLVFMFSGCRLSADAALLALCTVTNGLTERVLIEL